MSDVHTQLASEDLTWVVEPIYYTSDINTRGSVLFSFSLLVNRWVRGVHQRSTRFDPSPFKVGQFLVGLVGWVRLPAIANDFHVVVTQNGGNLRHRGFALAKDTLCTPTFLGDVDSILGPNLTFPPQLGVSLFAPWPFALLNNRGKHWNQWCCWPCVIWLTKPQMLRT